MRLVQRSLGLSVFRQGTRSSGFAAPYPSQPVPDEG
jgi:hypothetical protein